MKKLNFALLLTALISVGGGKSYAHDIEVANADGVTIYYNFTNNKTELAVTYKEGTLFDGVYVGKVVIPKSVAYEGTNYPVTSISDYAFRDCSDLTEVSIPSSVTYIINTAFWFCTSLEKITVESGNPRYDSRNNCNAIIDTERNELHTGCKNTQIPNNVTSIGHLAFLGCSGLTEVTIPKSVTSIGNQVFNCCSGLEKITVESGNHIYDSRENCNAIINTKNNELITGCNNTQIPNSVTSIGYCAFSGCSGLTELTIPNSVTTIDERAFEDCSGLTELIIGNSVTSIGEHAFSGCSGLTELTIPNSVISIGENAFYGCSRLEKITVESGNPNYDSRENCNAIINTNSNELIIGCKNTQIPNSVTSIGNYAFYECSDLTKLTIPNSVTTIGNWAFYGCSGLTELTIGNSVTSIGEHTFRNCSGLTELTIPNSVTSIDNYAFYGCSGLTELTIPNSVTSIDNYAFYGCSGLTELTIPNSVTFIGDWTFSACTALATLYSLNTTPPVAVDPFSNNQYMTVDLYVPEEALEAYKIADIWKKFKNLHAIGGSSAITEVTATEQIQTANGQIVVTGLTDGTTITVYDLGGQQIGSTVSKGGQAAVSTGLTTGALAVVKMGERSVKVTMK